MIPPGGRCLVLLPVAAVTLASLHAVLRFPRDVAATESAVASSQAARATGVYHEDPQHLWNRLHEALFVRVGNNGQEYGRDRVEPLLWRGSRHLLGGESHERLIRLLDEFNRAAEPSIAGPLERAMLQRDLWLVFSWLESSHDEFYGFGGKPQEWRARQERLRIPLARAIGRVRLSLAEIAALPDTYASAVASREFGSDVDAAEQATAYLPPDLYAPGGPWVALGRDGGLIAPSHVLSDNPFTNSAFLVFINLPDGRAATRAYVERLHAFRGPLFVPTRASRDAVFPNFNPAIPQFPAGTRVALVRRALLVTDRLAIAASPLTESVQVRVYRDVPATAVEDLSRAMLITDAVRSSQAAFEFVLSRKRLFAAQSGGLRAVGDEPDFLTGFSTHGVDPFEAIAGEPSDVTAARPAGALGMPRNIVLELRQPRQLDRCLMCHQLPGVYSFNTFAQNFGAENGTPKRVSPATVDEVLKSAVAWKSARPDWLLLKTLLGAR